MYDAEKTEELIQQSYPIRSTIDRGPHRNGRKRLLVILTVVLIVLIMAIASFFIYRAFFSNRGELTEALNNLEQGNYEEAERIYTNLYKETSDKKYELLAQNACYGITNGNLNNGGYVTFQGTNTYMLVEESNNSVTKTFSIYKIDESQRSKVVSFDVSNEASRVGYLNVWKKDLYLVIDRQIRAYNMDTQEWRDIPVNSDGPIMIYKDNLYYSLGRVVSCNLDGSNAIDSSRLSQANMHSFIIENDVIYENLSDSDAFHSKIYMRPTNSDITDIEEITPDLDGIVNSMGYYDNKLYYFTVRAKYSLPNYHNSSYDVSDRKITELDLSTRDIQEIEVDGLLNSMNLSLNNIYCLVNSTLYCINLDEQTVTTFSKISGTKDEFNLILLSPNHLFIYIMNKLDWPSLIENTLSLDQIYWTQLNNPGNLEIFKF